MREWEKHLERAEEKLNSAQILFEHNLFNDSVSESYYSMYHAAQAILLLKDSHPRTHRGLISEFGLQLIATGSIEEFYGKRLAVAEDQREKVDYDVYYRAPQEEAKKIIQDAKKFMERIKKAIEELN